MDATTGDFARDNYQEIVRFYDRVRDTPDDYVEGLIPVYNQVRKKFYFIMEQTGEEVIKGILNNHLTFIEHKILSRNNDRAIRRREIRDQIDHLNQQLNLLDDTNPVS